MKQVIINFQILFLIASFTGCNQINSKKTDEIILKQANAFGQSILDKDFRKVANKIYPAFIKKIGNEKLLKGLNVNDSSLIKQEIKIDSIRFNKQNKTIDTGKELITPLNETDYGFKYGLKMIRKGSIIAISEDHGIKWTFMPVGGYNSETIRDMFPNLQVNLVIQKSTTIILEDTPQSNFKVFWNDFKNDYPVFQLNNIDWDSVYAVNYPKISFSTSQSSLFNIFKSCIFTLKDAHSDILSSQFGNCDYYNTVTKMEPSDYISWKAICNYVPLKSQTIVTNNIKYGFINNGNIGYVFIGSFGGKKSDYLFIDDCLKKFKDAKGIVIDIRQNSGGNEDFGQIIASRFTNRSIIYRYSRSKSGSSYSDFSDFMPLKLDSGSAAMFTKKIVVLTSRKTFSAAEDFTLMLRSFPNVIQIGENTFGGVGTHPEYRTLPNGWKYRISLTMNCDNNKRPIKNGIIPQIPIQYSDSELYQGKDQILEKAIDIINKE